MIFHNKQAYTITHRCISSPRSLFTRVKGGIKDLIQPCHCLSHSPDFCLLIGPRAFDMLHSYSPSLLKAPTRHGKQFPRVLSGANAKDWDVCTHYEWWMSPDVAIPEDRKCITVVMTSSRGALTARAIQSGKLLAVAMSNHRQRLELIIHIVHHQLDTAFISSGLKNFCTTVIVSA